MNWDIILALVFYFALYIFFVKNRKKFEVQGKVFVLYKTKWGIKLMDAIAKKFPRLLNALSYVSIIIGFLGMIIMSILLIKLTLDFLIIPNAPSQVAPVLPGVKIPGMPVLSFWHWIIAILVIATMHEFFHGIYARLNNIKVKSSGFAFLGPILAAFVEPDEKQMEKKSKKTQLAVLSAGPFINIAFGFVIFALIALVLTPLNMIMAVPAGTQIYNVIDNSPAQLANLKPGLSIDSVNSINITSAEDFQEIISSLKPGDALSLVSNTTKYSLTLDKNPKNESKAYLGIAVGPREFKIKDSTKSTIWFEIYSWFVVLFLWLFVISLGVGLFNLLPIGPVDGGRMFYLATLHFTKNSTLAKKFVTGFTIFFLLLILINLLPYIVKLFAFIGSVVALIL